MAARPRAPEGRKQALRTALQWMLRIAALIALVGALGLIVQIGWTRCELITAKAPRAMVSLQMARSTGEAAEIIEDWRDPETPETTGGCRPPIGSSRIDVARDDLQLDDWFILAYSATLALTALIVLPLVSAPRWLSAGVVISAIAAGLCDLAENRFSETVLSVERPTNLGSVYPHVVAKLRIFAQMKWGLVLVVVLGIATAALAAVRRWWLELPDEAPCRATFSDLANLEANEIVTASGRPDGTELKVSLGSSDEHWVSFRSHDLVGLALSGGGIRSATFNLGLLSGLQKLKVLSRIDYLATVSGGGYIGGFWTAWLTNRVGPAAPGAKPMLWPSGNGAETGPVRHLREFSRFLAARRGFFEAEMWEAIVAVVAGFVLAFVAASSVIGLGLVAWLGTNFFLACPEPWGGVTTVLVLSLVITFVFERGWAAGSPPDDSDVKASRWVDGVVTLFALALAIVVECHYVHPLPRRIWSSWNGFAGWTPLTASPYESWWRLTGIERTREDAWFWSPRLYDLALVWLVPGVILLALRAPFAVLTRRGGRNRVWGPAFDRVVMRLLGSALGWAAIATLWHASINFLPLAGRMTAVSLISGGAFAALRNWIGVSLRAGTQASSLARLKSYLPELLAYLTVALLIAGVGSVLICWGEHDWFRWYTATGAMGFAIVAMLILDPAEIGLHSFYRDRIVRAYSGASNPDSGGIAQKNRQTDRRAKDDLLLKDLPTRPLHLVCCAANDLSGDPIETLARGARSATLSRHGIAMAEGWAPLPQWLTLGGAVTASAAAFNSNMGSVSMSVGPVVAFLMSALNLRLGLWVPNPRCEQQPALRRLPGVLFFREMFALTLADKGRPEIHLSDGGHFENLALYELVRRHCRYIVVSDCGEDPSVAFDDFGNAARRIREDFGVSIDIDLSALRPDSERRSRQHVVVGTIHYTDFDKGILLYVKPTLTGDEPPDVLQHATRNQQFPHEPTSDQFYDEAQWESYRKLGEHTACTVFGFVDRHPGSEVPPADWIFTTARQDWYPTPPDLPRRVLEMTERFGSVETDLQRAGTVALLHEVFPEVRLLFPSQTADASQPKTPTGTVAGEEHAANLACLLRVTQLMEDVWASCQLDSFWNHPLNLGWVNCFARWTSAPTFRMWWSLLRPMYSSEFQRFMQERFPVLDHDGSQTGTVLGPSTEMPDGLAAEWWQRRHVPGPELADKKGQQKIVYRYHIELLRPDSPSRLSVQVGLVLVRREEDATPSRAWWSSDDFFVPPSLWGAGLGGAFLRQFLEMARADQKLRQLDVFVKAPRDRNDPGSWADRVSYVEFYKKQGLRIVGEVKQLPDGDRCRAVHLQLSV